MKIGVIGGGVVGKATARCFMEQHEVRVFDIDPKKGTGHSILQTVAETDLCFVCLPTPQRENSLACNTDYVEDFFREMATDERELRAKFVLRSTVPIGFTKRMVANYGLYNLVHSPEFLTARCSITDAQVPARNIVGLPSSFNAPELRKLYAERFPGTPCITMSSGESEAVKLFLNGFFAVKVAYFNEVRCLADALNLDWETVMQGVMSDGRIAHSHTQVPGPDGRFGFGGACLPKDLANLQSCIMGSACSASVVRAAGVRNRLDRERKV